MNGHAAAGAAAGAAPHPSLFRRVLRVCLKAQWIVGGTCAVVAIAYPQTEVYGCICGAFVNAFLAKLLKRAIAQDRPMFAAEKRNNNSRKRSSSRVAPPLVPMPSSAADASVGHRAEEAVKEAASEVAAAAVDAAVFAADTLGVAHPEPTPLLASLPHPMPTEKELGHGMPSSHAMSLFYFATYLSLAAYSYDTRPVLSSAGVPAPPHPFISLLQTHVPQWLQLSWTGGYARPVAVSVLYVLVSLECWTRIRRRLHSWQQICVGGLLGATVAWIHTRVGMPLVRELSKDVPPLAERSTQFKIVLVTCFTIVALLTLERTTQRYAKRFIKVAVGKLRGAARNKLK